MDASPGPLTVVNQPITPELRYMFRRHLPAVAEIDRRSFDFALDDRALRDYFDTRLSQNRERVGVIAEWHGVIVGYALYQRFPRHVRLHRLAVTPGARRRGVGRVLAAKVARSVPPGRDCVVIDCRESNLPAQVFFRSLGYRCVCTLPEWFKDTGEAGYRFVLKVEDGCQSKGGRDESEW